MVPRGTSSVVSRLRMGADQRRARLHLLTPRIPMDNLKSESMIPNIVKSHTSVVVEVVRDGPTPDANCVNLGQFVIGKGANPASIAHEFGVDYGLSATQVIRLEEKLRINMQAIFGK